MSTKAQQTLVHAFNELVLERRYEDIFIVDIIKRADVSRSTFYEHFQNKEEILRNNLNAAFIPIAEACVGIGSQEALTQVLEHFADVRPLAVAYFKSPLSQVMGDLLGQLIKERLQSIDPQSSESIPRSLLSLQIAESILGLVKAWLRNPEFKVGANAIAYQIMISSNAVIAAGYQD